MDIKQFMPKISESDLRKEVRKEYANAEVVQKHDIFEGVPNPSSALDYGTRVISLRALKR